MSRNIIALSGGLASAYTADFVLKNIDCNAILYFNDTKWEHEDLFRFLKDLENYWNKEIFFDVNGSSPEDIFYEKNFLGNNRVPLCSRFLKAEMLQKFAQKGDTLFFGIDLLEKHRAVRIAQVYSNLEMKTRFPLIENEILKPEIYKWLKNIGIEIPALYKMGFKHNNCSGGCVRSGKKQWLHLLKVLPKVYEERERVENEFSLLSGKNYSFMKDKTLTNLRSEFEALSNTKQQDMFDSMDETDTVSECIGICNLEN